MKTVNQTFREWIKNPGNYANLYKVLYTKPGFEEYRHIKHEEVIEASTNIEFDYPRQVMIPNKARHVTEPQLK